MLTIILFIIISFSVYLLTLGAIKTINSEEAFFTYLYSSISFLVSIGIFAFSYSLFDISLQDLSFNLSILWLLTSVLFLIILIIYSIQKKPIVRPAVISSISFAVFSIAITVYLTLAIL